MILTMDKTNPVFMCTLVCMIYALISGGQSTSFVEVETKSGRVKGFNSEFSLTTGSVTVNEFLGIPYAKPPVDDKRFARPEPIDTWDETYEATNLPNACPQVIDNMFGDFEGSQMWNANTNISEDCLYLNIWTPDVDPDEPLAVLVWIYGGSFTSGSATLDIYNGRPLSVKGNVVVVSVQFRTGAIGFLYLDTPGAPGNMGLIDQAVALQWISRNIESFGGDKSRITLFGESSGAASCSLQTFSPLSKEYINNVILQSGTAISKWAVDLPDVALDKGRKLASSLGCDGDGEQMLACLKTKDPINISAKALEVLDMSSITTPFCPTIDHYFLHDKPINLINSGQNKKLDTLLGMVKNEGTYFLIYEGYVGKNNNVILNKQEYKDIVQKMINEHNEDLYNLVSYEYESGGYSEFPNYVDFLDSLQGDISFSCSVVELAEKYADQGNNVFMYYFTHRTSANPWPEWTGVMHGYEIDHVFGAPLSSSHHRYHEAEQQLSSEMVSYWSNFAKFG